MRKFTALFVASTLALGATSMAINSDEFFFIPLT